MPRTKHHVYFCVERDRDGLVLHVLAVCAPHAAAARGCSCPLPRSRPSLRGPAARRVFARLLAGR